MGLNQKRSGSSAAADSYKDWSNNILFSPSASHGSSQIACQHTCAEYKRTEKRKSPEDSAMDDVTVVESCESERDSPSDKRLNPSYDDIVQHILKTRANLTHTRRAIDTLTLSFLEAELQSKYLLPCKIYFQWMCTFGGALITPESSLGMEGSLSSSEHGPELHLHPVKDLGHVLNVEKLFQNAISYHTSLCADLNVFHRLISSLDTDRMKTMLEIKIRMHFDELERFCEAHSPPGIVRGRGKSTSPCMIGCVDLRIVYELVILILKRYRDSDIYHDSIDCYVIELQRERRHHIDRLERLTKFGMYKTGLFSGNKMNSLFQEIYLQKTSLCQCNIQDCKMKLINLIFGRDYEKLDLHSVQSVYMDDILAGRP